MDTDMPARLKEIRKWLNAMLARRGSANMEKLPEFILGNPAQISKAAVASTNQRSQHYWPQSDVMFGQLLRTI
jgi:hypothetical protein